MADGAQTERYKAIFGSGSELSDSDDDQRKDTRPARSPAASSTRSSSPTSSRSASPGPAAVRRRTVTPSDESDADGYASAEDEPDRAKAALKKKRAQVGEKRKRVTQKKERRQPKSRDDRSPDAEVPEMDEAARRRYELERRMDAALKGGKKKRKVKKGDDEINIDNQADEEVADAYKDMVKAVQDDLELNSQRKPASNKVKILTKVMGILQNVTMQQSILDSPDFLQGIRQFLEPLNDGSLPSLTIQRSIFEQLKKMDITKEILKESGLGKIILFYTKTKKATPEITRQANFLYDKWTRLVVNQGTAEHQHAAQQQRDESEEDERDRDGDRARDGNTAKRRKDLGGELLKMRVESRNDDDTGSKSTRIPGQVGHAYHEAPQPIRSRKDAKEEDAAEARRREIEKLNRFKRKAQLASSGR